MQNVLFTKTGMGKVPAWYDRPEKMEGIVDPFCKNRAGPRICRHLVIHFKHEANVISRTIIINSVALKDFLYLLIGNYVACARILGMNNIVFLK